MDFILVISCVCFIVVTTILFLSKIGRTEAKQETNSQSRLDNNNNNINNDNDNVEAEAGIGADINRNGAFFTLIVSSLELSIASP